MNDAMTIARPYAKAAFAVAKQADDVSLWLTQLGQLAEVVSVLVQDKHINDPHLSGDHMFALCMACLPEADEAFQAFLHLLISKRRLPVVPMILKWFESAHMEDQGLCEVIAESAHPLEADYIERLSRQLKQRIKREVRCTNTVNPKLLGGVRLRVGDHVMDATLRGRLDQLRQQLMDVAIPNSEKERG